ncbi:MAG: YlxR family protein [Deltaproteobacteria bacterium]|nr:YlxR family protein [Deltaproteobacteria bacterium]
MRDRLGGDRRGSGRSRRRHGEQGGSLRPVHVPVRTCAGCGQRARRDLLRRIALDPRGGVEWRAVGGRGTYLHQNEGCARAFAGGKPVVRGLRARVSREARENLLASGAAVELGSGNARRT